MFWRNPVDRLERYLDEVCRSVGGSRAMRQHIRQELREHLLDAVAQRKAAGMTEEAALDAGYWSSARRRKCGRSWRRHTATA